jgi:hypothetical protein
MFQTTNQWSLELKHEEIGWKPATNFQPTKMVGKWGNE